MMINISKAKKILIIRLSSLGDILLTTPLAAELKRKNPEIIIDFLLKPEFADVYKFNPSINNLLIYDKNNPNAARNLIKQNKYDLIIDLQNNLRTLLLLLFLRIRTVKFRKPFFKKIMLVKFKKNFFNKIIPIPELYAKTIKLDLASQQGLELFNIDGKIEFSATGKTIGFCPGSKHFTKIWPEEYFVELGNLLFEKGFEIWLFGGTKEKDKCKYLSNRIRNAKDFSTDNNLFETAEKMRKCKLIVTNDSALMHIASALKIPIVAIFGSSVKEFGFAPFNTKNEILEITNLDCRPCSHIGRDSCPAGHFKCMNEIKPEMVLEKINLIID